MQSGSTVSRASRWLLALAAFSMIPGCLASGVYRTARTLDPGEGDLGLTFSATRFSGNDQTVTDSTGKQTTVSGPNFVLPNVIPEVSYHIGVADDLELGGRVALGSLLLEMDAKYRFLRTDLVHLALAPALGYRALGFIEGPSLTLPLIATFDVNEHFSVNAAPYVSYTNLTSTDSELKDVSGKFLSAGGSIGVEVRGKTAHIMPSIDFSQTVMDLADASGTTATSQRFVIFSLTFGWVSGRELKKLEKMDEKLDRIEDKLDRK